MERKTPVFIVCSLGPRVGKTLLARVLTEFFLANSRPVVAFDVNPDEFALADYLPAYTAVATINDIRGQMALFDQVVAADHVAKVIDLGHSLFIPFFTMALDLDFVGETTRRGVAPVVLFLADPGRRSRQSYAMLRDRFPNLALVPVFNEAVPVLDRYRDDFPPTRKGGRPLVTPALAEVIRTVLKRPRFSFVSYCSKTTDTTSELYGWTQKLFLEFRDLELRLMVDDLKSSLKFTA
jgi:hypothetical protein